jgi:microcompartment protein CcmK/EutM
VELGKVLGQVVATARDPKLPNMSLLLVALLDGQGEPTGTCHVAADPIGAGEGEWVLLVRGSSARRALEADAPLDLTVVGIIDHVTAGKETIYRKH